VGAGLGSLTVALAETGAEVLALEVDRGLLPALEEVTVEFPHVRAIQADAARADWRDLLGEHGWRMASNLPYNVAVPVVLDLLQDVPSVDPMVVMVQREVGERLIASAGQEAFGAVSLRVAYRADAKLLRRVESVLVRLERRPPPVAVSEEALFRLVDAGFAQRRKTMANALVRLGYERGAASAAIEQTNLDPRVRAEQLGLEDFALLVEALGV
jgi:16S rRNA (adenine1518-N6/adenine1519-N6)-dimethyltransferase